MKNFEYAQPRTESEALLLLNEKGIDAAVLAGGTDLIPLMKRMLVTPDRVVNIGDIESLRQISRDSEGNTWIGAAVRLDEILDDDIAQSLQAVEHVIQGISSVQLQSQGTLVGELLRRPTCWYFRDGHGLLAGQGRRVVEGDNRFHAILGNRGPAKFVNASRLAPALVAAGAMVRVIGPSPDQEEFVEIERLYRSPETDDQTENTLQPGQLVTHVVIPPASGMRTASYEVRHGEGPDEPLASAAVALQFQGSRVTQARVVLGQVAPMPWVADQAARMLVGNSITEELAARAGIEATSGAMALSMNEYKIQLAQVAVKRALLRAVDLETGGLDCTMTSDPARETESVHLA